MSDQEVAMAEESGSCPQSGSKRVVALRDYKSCEGKPCEVNLTKRDVMILLDSSDQNWWKVEINNRQGFVFVPAEYLMMLNFPVPIALPERNLNTETDVSVTKDIPVRAAVQKSAGIRKRKLIGNVPRTDSSVANAVNAINAEPSPTPHPLRNSSTQTDESVKQVTPVRAAIRKSAGIKKRKLIGNVPRTDTLCANAVNRARVNQRPGRNIWTRKRAGPRDILIAPGLNKIALLVPKQEKEEPQDEESGLAANLGGDDASDGLERDSEPHVIGVSSVAFLNSNDDGNENTPVRQREEKFSEFEKVVEEKNQEIEQLKHKSRKIPEHKARAGAQSLKIVISPGKTNDVYREEAGDNHVSVTTDSDSEYLPSGDESEEEDLSGVPRGASTPSKMRTRTSKQLPPPSKGGEKSIENHFAAFDRDCAVQTADKNNYDDPSSSSGGDEDSNVIPAAAASSSTKNSKDINEDRISIEPEVVHKIDGHRLETSSRPQLSNSAEKIFETNSAAFGGDCVVQAADTSGSSVIPAATGAPSSTTIHSEDTNVSNEPAVLHKIDEKLLENSQFGCICGMRYERRKSLLRHVLQQSGTKCFKCERCPEVFAVMCDLNQHLRRMHKTQPKKKFGCQFCGDKFKTRLLLSQHKKTSHRLDHPHLEKKEAPKTHGYAGAGLQGNMCKCGKSYQSRKSLWKHIATNMVPNNFKCPHCGAQFKDCSDLKKHVRRDHDLPNYDVLGCYVCGAMFPNRHQLSAHKNIMNHK